MAGYRRRDYHSISPLPRGELKKGDKAEIVRNFVADEKK